MLIAALIGTGPIADAFFVALKLPNLFRRLFGEGAFNAAFIPAFSGLLHTEGAGAAKQFAQEAFAVMAFWLGIMTILGEIFMPELMVVLAPGFAEDRGKFALAISLSRITFPYLVLICLAALVSGVLNGLEKFTAASASYVLFNIVSIACMIWMTPYVPTVGHALSWGVTISGVAQLGLLMMAVRRGRDGAQDTAATVDPADAAADAPNGARSGRGGSYSAQSNRRCDHREPAAAWHGVGAVFRGSGAAIAAWGDRNRRRDGAIASAVAASSSRGGSVSDRNAEPRHRVWPVSHAAGCIGAYRLRGTDHARAVWPRGIRSRERAAVLAVAGGLCARIAGLRVGEGARSGILRPRRHQHAGQDRGWKRGD